MGLALLNQILSVLKNLDLKGLLLFLFIGVEIALKLVNPDRFIIHNCDQNHSCTSPRHTRKRKKSAAAHAFQFI